MTLVAGELARVMRKNLDLLAEAHVRVVQFVDQVVACVRERAAVVFLVGGRRGVRAATEGCPIAHDAREPDLRAVLPRERAEAQRALEAAIENVPWQSRRPVRILVEETKDDVAIDRV